MTTYTPAMPPENVPYVHTLLIGVSPDEPMASEILQAAASLAPWQLDLALNYTCTPKKRADILKDVKDLTQDTLPFIETLLEGVPKPSKIFKTAKGLRLEQLQFIAQRDFLPGERDAVLTVAHTLKSEHIPPLLKLLKGVQKEDGLFVRALKGFTNIETLKEIVVANAPCLDAYTYPHIASLLSQVPAKKGVGFLMAIMGKPQEMLAHAATLPLVESLPYLRAQPIPLDWCFSHMGKLESGDFQIIGELKTYMSKGVQNRQDILARLFSQMTHPDPVTAKRTQKFVREFYKKLGLAEHAQKVDEILSLWDDLLERVAATRNPELLGKIIFGQEDIWHMGGPFLSSHDRCSP